MFEREKEELFPHLLLYWGKKGGGLRLLTETIHEIFQSGYSSVYVSVNLKTHKYLLSQMKLSEDGRNKIYNIRPPSMCQRIILLCKLPYSDKFLIKNFQHIRSLVIVMSSPGDLSIDFLRNYGVNVTRIIHDFQKHAGDLWPTNRTIQKMLKTQRVITLSKYVFENIEHPNKFQSSLARINVVADLESNLFENSQRYFISIGRFKKYKNLELLRKIAIEAPNENFIFAGVGSSTFKKIPNVKCIDRWLTDAEVEVLIKNSTALIAPYLEASQSGIVEQALYWRIPCIVSNRGALFEQVKQQNLPELLLDSPESASVAKLLQLNFEKLKKLIPEYVVKETLCQTLLRLEI